MTLRLFLICLSFEYNNENGENDDDDNDNDHDLGDYNYDGDSVGFVVLAISLLSINCSAYFLKGACLFLGIKGCL
jgi:hypothetical protein